MRFFNRKAFFINISSNGALFIRTICHQLFLLVSIFINGKTVITKEKALHKKRPFVSYVYFHIARFDQPQLTKQFVGGDRKECRSHYAEQDDPQPNVRT